MFNFSLRQKLLLVSLLILLVPWVGVRYIQAIESYLQQSLLDNLSHYTQSVASGLALQPELIPEYPSGEAIFALPLAIKPELDGYEDDWEDYTAYRQQLFTLSGQRLTVSNPSLLAGSFKESLYLHLTIEDNQIIYLDENRMMNTAVESKINQADSIQILLGSGEQQRTLLIQTEAPGSITARDLKTDIWESRIKGTWREQDDGDGYQVELKLPLVYLKDGFNISVNNVNKNATTIFRLAKTELVPLLVSPEKLTKRFSEIGVIQGRRLWLLDNEGRVLVKTGELITQGNLSPVNPMFAWLLTPQLIKDPWRGKTRLERDDIQSALSGKSDSRRLSDLEGKNIILSSAWPIKNNEQTIAVLLIEESTATIQIMQRSALSDLLNLSLFVFILIGFSLIGFAGRLGTRIRKLRDITDQSIDQHGRVNGVIPEIRQGDELDELANHITEMLHRLRQYHDYLEKLASSLSHELRTPIAVVRSSLENMQLSDLDTDNIEILRRADNGIMRLQTILNRMSEASRLEQSIGDSHIESFDLAVFMNDIIDGYRLIYVNQKFELTVDPGNIKASKDLIAQCMDKLINNAVSFSKQDTAVKIDGIYTNEHWILSVSNYGESLPLNMKEQLFQSMVSVRKATSTTDEPHLGLGLHIVRLIAEFHSGMVKASNIEGGVKFSIYFPNKH